MVSVVKPETMIDAYGKIISEDKELVEFFYRIHIENTIRLKDLGGRFLAIYNALVNFDFVKTEEKVSPDSRIEFTEIGETFWKKYGDQIEKLHHSFQH